jgi:anaerobic C4-dicarboxylate transporter DcuA/anaerobic C4-dicarboxylate transporter DcuB
MAVYIGLMSSIDFPLSKILSITFPAVIIGLLIASAIVNRLGKDIEDDPAIMAKIYSGEIEPPAAWNVKRGSDGTFSAEAIKESIEKKKGTKKASSRNKAKKDILDKIDVSEFKELSVEITLKAKLSGIFFIAGILFVVILGIFPNLRPLDSDGSAIVITSVIQVVMFSVSALILLFCSPNVKQVTSLDIFKAGMIAVIAIFGLMWMLNTYVGGHKELIASSLGSVIHQYPFIILLGIFVVGALTTSQTTSVQTMIPIGLAAGLPGGLLTGFLAAGYSGVMLFPINGQQIAAAELDTTGSTVLGKKMVDHSFFLPSLILAVSVGIVGTVFGIII